MPTMITANTRPQRTVTRRILFAVFFASFSSPAPRMWPIMMPTASPIAINATPMRFQSVDSMFMAATESRLL